MRIDRILSKIFVGIIKFANYLKIANIQSDILSRSGCE